MIIIVAGGTPLVGTATDDEGFVMLYGLRGDWDNPTRANYLKMLQGGAVGFLKGREWDGTAEDATRLYESGRAELDAWINSAGEGDEPDEVEGYL